MWNMFFVNAPEGEFEMAATGHAAESLPVLDHQT